MMTCVYYMLNEKEASDVILLGFNQHKTDGKQKEILRLFFILLSHSSWLLRNSDLDAVV